jgi:hypothetical protein
VDSLTILCLPRWIWDGSRTFFQDFIGLARNFFLIPAIWARDKVLGAWFLPLPSSRSEELDNPPPTHLRRGLADSSQNWPPPSLVIALQGLYGESRVLFNSGNRIQLIDAATDPYVDAVVAVCDATFRRWRKALVIGRWWGQRSSFTVPLSSSSNRIRWPTAAGKFCGWNWGRWGWTLLWYVCLASQWCDIMNFCDMI